MRKQRPLILLMMLGVMIGSAQAQVPAAARTAARAANREAAVHGLATPRPFQIPPTPLSSGAGAAATAAGLRSTTLANTQASARKQRSWWEQIRRNWKAAKLIKQHQATVKLAQQKSELPSLQPDQMRFLPSFEGMEISGEVIPKLPWMQEEGILYRGLGLPSGEKAIRNILENGLLIKDVGPDNNHLAMTYGGGSRGAVTQSSQMRFTNLTNDPETAFHYAERNWAEDRVLVLVRVSGLPQYNYVVRVDKDIAPEHIEEMIVLVSLNDLPTWCRVEWVEGQFRVTPYQPIFKRK